MLGFFQGEVWTTQQTGRQGGSDKFHHQRAENGCGIDGIKEDASVDPPKNRGDGPGTRGGEGGTGTQTD